MPSAPTSPTSPTTPYTPGSRAHTAALKYLKAHNVAVLVGKVTTQLTQERPPQPLQWVANRLRYEGTGDLPGATQYLKDTGIVQMIDEGVAAIVQEQPTQPLQSLADFIEEGRKRKRDFSSGGGATGHRPQHAPPPAGEQRDGSGILALASDPEMLGNSQRHLSASHTRKHGQSNMRVSFAMLEETRYTAGDVHDSDEEKMADVADGEDWSADVDPASTVKIFSKMSAIEAVFDELREHLLGAMWTDVDEGIEAYLQEKKKRKLEEEQTPESDDPLAPPLKEDALNKLRDSNDAAAAAAPPADSDQPQQPPPPPQQQLVPPTDSRRSSASDEGAADDPMAYATGIGMTLSILKESLIVSSSDGDKPAPGNVTVEIHVTENCSREAFAAVYDSFKENREDLKEKGVDVEFKSFPTAKKHNDFKQIITETQVLMWVRLTVTKTPKMAEPQAFEVFVNLMGGCCYRENSPIKKKFDYYDIIPSFGQLVNVQQPQRHNHLCNPDAVVRCSKLVEAVYHFKLSLVRVAEHIIQTVIQGEFLTDVARRLSKAGFPTESPQLF
eukprot:gene16526-25350_t